MSYRVIFERGWEWAKGGKLPGISGGVGRQKTEVHVVMQGLFGGLVVPGMFNTDSPLAESNEAGLLRVRGSRKNADYRISVGRGAFTWPVGRWVDVALRMKLNDVDKEDGQYSGYV
ncbi:uncharacterized protein EV420DRAFT_664947 [Desarmillaria tabescens]|uniref:Polysaccharide lyase 14 domain-containing protein n=1 Tax=Armillaria tabescens TaxID=1929756 RepID=A0AA39NK27_ARMTA|nr:uncharacterized protein EV420DRAFT_664947 [Desarmillaria tabescens]KAK0467088.1 hypothetical protein EV420DRAFT_664947 [Desarmillaria tabescens]